LQYGKCRHTGASAQVIGDALAFLVSYDKRILDVARSLGIPIAAPGMSR